MTFEELYWSGIDQGLVSDAAYEYAVQQYWGELLGYPVTAISSGRRSAYRQSVLRARWDSGDRAGLRARPAVNSAHIRGEAWDLSTVPHLWVYHELAKYRPIRSGLDFSRPDPGHFDLGRHL